MVYVIGEEREGEGDIYRGRVILKNGDGSVFPIHFL